MSPASAKIVVIGTTYVDMAIRCDEFPQSGETVAGAGVSYLAAGAGPNQAVQAALCGCDVHLISKIGNDPFGQMVANNLARLGVNTDLIYTTEAKTTGVMVTLVDHVGKNASCLCYGANNALQKQEISEGPAEELITSADICLVHGSVPRDVLVAAVQTATIGKTKIILDPALSVAQRPDKMLELPLECYSVDILIPDFQEAAELAGNTGLNRDRVAAARMFGSDLVARGAGCVIVKLGKRGCLVVDKTGADHLEAFDVDCVDHTVCSDAFAGALAASCAVGDDIRKAVKFACAAGALACSKFGGQEALPKKAEIIELLQNQH